MMSYRHNTQHEGKSENEACTCFTRFPSVLFYAYLGVRCRHVHWLCVLAVCHEYLLLLITVLQLQVYSLLEVEQKNFFDLALCAASLILSQRILSICVTHHMGRCGTFYHYWNIWTNSDIIKMFLNGVARLTLNRVNWVEVGHLWICCAEFLAGIHNDKVAHRK